MDSVLPLLVVIVGWLVVNYQHNNRESRKEGRALIDAAKKEVREIAKLGVEYFGNPKSDVAFDIKAQLESLEIELERLQHFKLPNPMMTSPLMKCFIEFSEAITGGDFESSAVPVGRDSPLVLDILATRNALLAQLERQFVVYYL